MNYGVMVRIPAVMILMFGLCALFSRLGIDEINNFAVFIPCIPQWIIQGMVGLAIFSKDLTKLTCTFPDIEKRVKNAFLFYVVISIICTLITSACCGLLWYLICGELLFERIFFISGLCIAAMSLSFIAAVINFSEINRWFSLLFAYLNVIGFFLMFYAADKTGIIDNAGTLAAVIAVAAGIAVQLISGSAAGGYIAKRWNYK